MPFRAAAPNAVVSQQLGPLDELSGKWAGSGFNLIAVPKFGIPSEPFRLLLNSTKELLEFTKIGAPVPNRGLIQHDIFLNGLTYQQTVSDAVTSAGLHIEEGIWINVPNTTGPPNPATVVRLATIPHGDSVLAQGTGFDVQGGPQIDVVSSLPQPDDPAAPPLDAGYLAPYSSTPLPPAPPAGIEILNPNNVLTTAIQGQTITKTTVLQISTLSAPPLAAGGGILNIPFVTSNAAAVQLDAIFWIETVQQPDGTEFLQLQYTQTVILNFLGINWPHISVATLIKQ